MDRWDEEWFPLEEEKRRRLQERLGKAGQIGAVLLLAVVAVLAILMFVNPGETNGIAIERETSVLHEEGSSEERDTEASTKRDAQPMMSVYVSGAVVSPGVYELEDGSRVIDAIGAAGGMDEDAATDSVNLARKIQDGEQIHIPLDGEQSEQGETYQHTAGNTGGMVNINTADAQTLEGLPGVGPATAQKIIEERTANGPFSSVDDLQRVSGIGDKKLDALRGSICV